jgi:hypothetical protein
VVSHLLQTPEMLADAVFEMTFYQTFKLYNQQIKEYGSVLCEN